MAEPFLHHVERDAGGDSGHPEAVPQPFGRCMCPIEPGFLHHRMNHAPAGHARPRPKLLAASLAAPRMLLANAMDHIQRFEQHRGNRDGPIDTGGALFEAFKHQRPGGEVDPIDGERQRFGEPATGIGEGHAKRTDFPLGAFRFAQERLPLADGEIFPRPVRGMQPHAACRDRRGRGQFRR